MKILKFLTGGTPTFLAITNPFSAPLNQPTASSSKSQGLIDEDLINKLYDKGGIPVDVENYLDKVAKLEHEQSLGLPITAGTIRLLQAMSNRIILQANYLKNAEEAAAKNDALGEIAVGSRGELYIADKKEGVKSISLKDFDADSMIALTVGELIELRKFNPTLAFNMDIIPVAGRNVGLSKINEYILNIIKTVGSASSVSEAYTDLAGYIGQEAAKRPSEQELYNLLLLQLAISQMGSDAIFKNKLVMKSKNIQEALTYIESVLPIDMKRLLMSRHVAAGNTYESSGQYMRSIIAQALMSSNDTKQENYINYDASVNKAAGTLAGAKELNRNLGVLELLVLGDLGKRDYKLMSSKSPEYSLNLHGTGVGSLASFNNNIIDKTPISVALKAGLAPLVDELHISAGNQKISAGMLDSILYNGEDVINVWAPVKSNGDIDLDGLATLSEILSICDTNPQLTLEDKNNLLAKYGLDGHFDRYGKFIGGGNMAQFLVMTGMTSDEIIDEDSNPFIDKVSKKDKQFELDQIERIYGLLNKGVKGKGKYEFKTGWFNATTDLYRVPIFMKLSNTAQIDVGTFGNKGPLVTTPTYEQQMIYDQMRNSSKQLITPSTAALYE